MSDALKLVSAAQKEFDAVLGSKVRPEKKRPVGDKAIAAYQQFAEFARVRREASCDR